MLDRTCCSRLIPVVPSRSGQGTALELGIQSAWLTSDVAEMMSEFRSPARSTHT